MKNDKIIFWVTTGIIFLTQGIAEIFIGMQESTITGLMQLGYPAYFLKLLVVFKVLGAFALILPQVPKMVKEWAYVGFGFDFIFAFLSVWIVSGVNAGLAIPVVAMILLVLSYRSYHKLN